MMPCTGVSVPATRAYKKFLVKHRLYFLRWGTDTEISLISRSTGSRAAASGPATWPFCDPFACVGVAMSTRLLLDDGPSSAAVPDRRS